MTNSRFIYSYDGVVKAGIDFAGIGVEKDDENRRIAISLPKARVLSSELDENSFQLYDEKNSIFNRCSVSDVNITNRELKRAAEEKTIAKGLLDRADDNAKLLIKGLLQSTYDVSGYTIQIETR